MKIYLRVVSRLSTHHDDRFDVNENHADFNWAQPWKKFVAVCFLQKAIIRLQKTLNTDH